MLFTPLLSLVKEQMGVQTSEICTPYFYILTTADSFFSSSDSGSHRSA